MRVYRHASFTAAAICLTLLFAASSASANDDDVLSKAEASTNEQATALNLPGLPNAFKITDNLYRGAQPEANGFAELRKLGIKTIVSLRAFHSDNDIVKDIGIPVESIPIKTWKADEDDIVRFLKIATDTNRTPVFVHCQHGADRTGTMVAVYRMAVCNWTKEAALDEMVNGGFGFHKAWSNLVKLVNKLDIEAIKRKAGIAAPTKGKETE